MLLPLVLRMLAVVVVAAAAQLPMRLRAALLLAPLQSVMTLRQLLLLGVSPQLVQVMLHTSQQQKGVQERREVQAQEQERPVQHLQ